MNPRAIATARWPGPGLALLLLLGASCERAQIAARDLCQGQPCDAGARPGDASLADAPSLDQRAGDDVTGAGDATAVDTSRHDVGIADAAQTDREPADATAQDLAMFDGARPDAWRPDSALADSAHVDARPADTAAPDSAQRDATSADQARADSAALDVAPVDSVQPDTAQPDTAQPDTAVVIDAARPDAAAATSLAERVAVHSLSVAPSAVASSTSYEYGPLLATLPDGRAKLAWCDSAAKKIYVRHLAADLATSERADSQVTGSKLFGLVAHADGTSALLAVRDAPASCTPCTASESCVSCNELHLVQLATDGSLLQSAMIDDRLAHSGQFSGGDLALGSHNSVEAYAVARTVRGAGPDASASAFCVSSARNSGHQWHETWLYRTSDLGLLTSGCNVFPCGHSMFKRSLRWHPDSGRFGSVCMSDYSGTRTGFNYAEDNGWNSRLYNVWLDWPDFVNGGHPSELVLASSSSYLVALSAPQSCATDCAAEDHDLALMEVGHASKSVVGGPFWIRTTAAAQSYPHLARYGSAFLVGWAEGSARWLAELDGSGQVLGEPVDLAGVASFDYGSNWQTLLASGDVVWLRRSGTSAIEIVRVLR